MSKMASSGVPPPPTTPRSQNPVQPQPTFALVPALAGSSSLPINYETREGQALYTRATKSLYISHTDHFDLQSENLQHLLDQLGSRATQSGWEDALLIPDVPTTSGKASGPWRNILTHHGTLTMQHLKTFAITYIDEQSREAQINQQIVTCINNSLSKQGQQKISAHVSEWKVEVPSTGAVRSSWILLLKVIIRESYIDTNATSRILREKLSSLPHYLKTFNNDITALNSFVLVTLQQLTARGETTSDLVSNLFKGYLSAKDPTFVSYIMNKQEKYDEGTSFTHLELMNLAANKYKVLVENKTWLAPSTQDRKIIALEAQIAGLKKKSTLPKERPKADRKSNNNKQESRKKKDRRPTWATTKPNDENIDKPKLVDGKEHWWCPHHGRFVCHQPAECRLKPDNASKQPSNQGSQPQLRVSAAMQALLLQEDA